MAERVDAATATDAGTADAGTADASAPAPHDAATDAGAAAAQEIGREGGVVQLGDVTLSIPPGALAEPTAIAIAVGSPSDLQAGIDSAFSFASEVYKFSPAGLSFALPITVTIASSSAADSTIFWSQPDPADGFMPLEPLANDPSSAQVTHFSLGFRGTILKTGQGAVGAYCNDPILGGGHAEGDSCCLKLFCAPGLRCENGKCAFDGCYLNGITKRVGNQHDSCGAHGDPCDVCSYGLVCDDSRKCVCSAALGGCCDGNDWNPGDAANACGNGGKCVDCTKENKVCKEGACVCDGCLDGDGDCQLGTDSSACGSRGNACAECKDGLVCNAKTGSCECRGCTMTTGDFPYTTSVCMPGTTLEACGPAGSGCNKCETPPASCADGATLRTYLDQPMCTNGQCVPPEPILTPCGANQACVPAAGGAPAHCGSCGPDTCPGCCDADGKGKCGTTTFSISEDVCLHQRFTGTTVAEVAKTFISVNNSAGGGGCSQVICSNGGTLNGCTLLSVDEAAGSFSCQSQCNGTIYVHSALKTCVGSQ